MLIWAFLQHTLSREGEDWQDKSANTNTVEVLVFQQEIKKTKNGDSSFKSDNAPQSYANFIDFAN